MLPIPKFVHISMAQHIGAPCRPLVEKDDYVKVGQKIGDTDAFVSAPIHSSVSGTVVSVDYSMSGTGNLDQMVVIKTDGLQEISEEVVVPKVENREEFLKAVRASGMVGLGGASFPTHVKYSPKNLDEVDSLIINAAECEPYITSDYQNMMEDADYVIAGTELVMKYLEIPNGYIGIEKNKPDAIALYEKLTAGKPIDVISLPSMYPKGAEKVLMYEIKGRMIEVGQLPADIGCIVSNVTTVLALAKYFETGMPLITKKLTVDGSAIESPKNVIAPIGARVIDVILYCEGYKAQARKVIMGGPMMGRTICSDALPILKSNNAILAFDHNDAVVKVKPETQCINCGRCHDYCPFGLMSTLFSKAFEAGDTSTLERLNVMACMECGCCTYVCPAGKQLALTNKMAKQMVATKAAEDKAKAEAEAAEESKAK
jgi:electron transport complex protein RnfC